ncbi:MAG: HAD hydrolase-like protein [Bacteroidetes bacterium]|nr:HAD hydrolase-like protein [Bacteroidota bacterium]
MTKVKVLFLDIGGVLLSNGWDRGARKKAVQVFNLDETELNERHHLTFDTYEQGKLSLDEYLNRVIFYTNRNFSKEQFKAFMFQQSTANDDMIAMIKEVKQKNNLRIAVVNNEGRELNEHRINSFGISEFADFFISSCFVHLRKPDVEIFKLALDISHAKPHEVFYIDDRSMFVQIAEGIGIKGVIHEDIDKTKIALKNAGLLF